jgi:hypothetical protein
LGTELRPGYGEYDHISITFEHKTGISGALSFADYMEGNNNYFVLRGTDGTIRYEQDKIVIMGNRNETLKLPPIDASFVMWEQCANWLSVNEKVIYGPKETLEDVEILMAINKSLNVGEKVRLV